MPGALMELCEIYWQQSILTPRSRERVHLADPVAETTSENQQHMDRVVDMVEPSSVMMTRSGKFFTSHGFGDILTYYGSYLAIHAARF